MALPAAERGLPDDGPLADEVDVLVVGAGQAGLAASHALASTPLRVLVVDRAPVGQSWVDRWDSLVLFTPRRYSALPGLAFPPGPGRCPTRLEMARYLRSYAAHHRLPVRAGVEVRRLSADGSRFVADTSSGAVRARDVVVATGPFSVPSVPAASDGLADTVVQLHSRDYRTPRDVPGGDLLVVGGGNSAAQLAVELAATHRVTVAASRPPWYLPTSVLGLDLYRWLSLTGLLTADRDSRTARYVRRRGDPVVGTTLRDLVRAGRVDLRPSRVVLGHGDAVELADGSRLAVSTVLWCTGYRPDSSWLDVPGALDARGAPVQVAGASPVAGLHWLGLPWQTRLDSAIVHGLGHDARVLAGRVLAR